MTDGETVPVVAGRYERIRKLGAGGQGEAWLAHDTRLRRRVVLKRLTLPDGLSPAEVSHRVARAEREARAAGALDHPGIVTVFDQFADHGGMPWIVMEYIEGPSLREALEPGPLPVGEVARIGAQVAAALAAAHRRGVVHRDVKPANILLADGRAVLADFGIASAPDEVTLTATGAAIGTPQFMAPEQLGAGASSPASDLWSLGATLYCAVEGHAPYPGDPGGSLRRAGALEPLIRQLMQREPAARPTAADAAAALEDLVTDLETHGRAAIDRLLAQATEERDHGELGRAEDQFWTALDLAIQRHARRQEGWAWDGLGSCRWRADDPEMAMRFFTRAARIGEETDDALLRTWSLHNFGAYWRRREDPVAAREFFDQSLALADAHRFAAPRGWIRHQLAEMAAEAGDARREKEHYAAAADIALEAGADALAGWSLFNLARSEERADELPQAREHYARAQEIGARIRNRWMAEQSEDALRRLTPPG